MTKTWTYEEITAAAERRIHVLKKMAGTIPDASAEMCARWAGGVYLGWYAATEGWQDPSDEERLSALASSIGPHEDDELQNLLDSIENRARDQ